MSWVPDRDPEATVPEDGIGPVLAGGDDVFDEGPLGLAPGLAEDFAVEVSLGAGGGGGDDFGFPDEVAGGGAREG